MSSNIKEKMDSGKYITPDEAREIARDAYIYGFPIVDNYRIQYAYFVDKSDPEYKGGWNTVHNTSRVYTPDDKAIQTPNSDTPYSFVGADLRAEPLVITVPEVEKGRYYSLQFIDMYTFNFAYLGSRITDNGSGSYLLAGPNWTGVRPDGIKGVIHCETAFAFILYRTQLFNAGDIANVKKIQNGYKAEPLSQFLVKPASKDILPVQFLKPLSVDDERKSSRFFTILNFLLQFCPVHSTELAPRERFSRLQIGAGKVFDEQSFPPELRKAIEEGMEDAWKIEREVHQLVVAGKVNPADVFGSRDYLKNNFPYRMAAAAGGIYGNSKEEAVYFIYYQDSDGKELDSLHNSYTLHFKPGQFPPVNAFWSVTLYKMPSQLLFANSLNRYLVNSPMLPDLKKDADGGLTIYISHKSPGKEKEPNWLPAPAGTFKIALRLYEPIPAVAQWEVPRIKK